MSFLVSPDLHLEQGYRSIALSDLKNARLLSRALENSGYYHVLSDIHRTVEDANTVSKGVKNVVGIDETKIEVRWDNSMLLSLIT